MSIKASHLQALFARRREAEHNRIERTEAVSKYFNHWDKVTSRFENWTAPDYYKQAEQQLENSKQQKEKQKKLDERQKKLSQLLDMEKINYERELQERDRNKNSKRRIIDTKTLEKIDKNLKEQQQIRRKLELEAKLYGKWRHGIEDDNLIFESKSDNEVLAKLNWLDKQVEQQLQREQEEATAKERQLKIQQELNKSEELQKERQKIREKEIHEIRCMQEYHLEQLKERQKETDDLKKKEKNLKNNLIELKKEHELLEESNELLTSSEDFADAHNFKKIKLFIRKRAKIYRNQIQLFLSILARCLEFAEKPEILKQYRTQLEHQLEKETENLSQIDGMYESEAKYSLQRIEDSWKREHNERHKELKQILLNEHQAINTTLNELIKRHEELLEIRSTHLGVIENSNEKLKLLVQEEENSPRLQNNKDDLPSQAVVKKVELSARSQTSNNIIHNQLKESANSPLYSPRLGSHDKTISREPKELHLPVDFGTRRNCYESVENNMSPRCTDTKRITNSFNNLNLDVWQHDQNFLSPRDVEKTTSQRSLQVVTPETEAERPRFGRKRVAWN